MEPAGVVLARPPENVPVTEVLEAIREPGLAALDFIFAHESVASVLRRRDDAVEQALDGVTLRSLATGVSTPEPAVANLSDYRRR